MKNKEDNIDFINLILMLNQNALVSLGEVPRLIGGKKVTNLAHARATINMLKSIQEKTKGNLTPGETKLLFRILGDLQKKYVEKSGFSKTQSEKNKKPTSQINKLEKTLEKLSDSQLSQILNEINKLKKDENSK